MNDGHLNFNEICKRLKVSKYRIAKDTGISENTLSYWSRGKTTPTLEVFFKVCKYLGVSPYELYDDDIDVEHYGVYGEMAKQIQILSERPDIAELVMIAAEAKKEDLIIVKKVMSALNLLE